MYFREVGNKASLLIAVPIVVLVIGVLIWSVLGQRDSMQLLPVLPEPTTFFSQDDRAPVTVSFTELNDDPVAYLNQVIVVSGSYLPVEHTNCLRYSGPDIRWSLTAENLQLDAIGYERIVRLLPVGSMMTVQGVWRFYQGPLGCGKGPPVGTAWYMDVKKILQPNPLISEGGQALPIIIGSGESELPELIPTLDNLEGAASATNDVLTVTPVGTQVIQPTVEGQVTFTPTPTTLGTPTPMTPASQTPTLPLATATPIGGTSVPGATSTPTATVDPSNPTSTHTPESPPVPPTATDVPDGYPGATETSVPTASPDPYPPA
ncbi:MAG: hypothetical protein R3293_21415 [Candidatus Promineifilaceae bacterium]|nr:hypothetical protein [Candidatus Promineifilaceae bacterium]